VLFDLDGTLSDSAPGIVGSLTTALRSLSLPVPPPEVLRLAIGPPFEVGLPLIGVPENQVDAVADAYIETYDVTGIFENQLYAGAVAMLETLSEAGCTLCLATAKPEPTAARVLEFLGIGEWFKFVGAATYGPPRNSKDQVIDHVLNNLGVVGGPDVVMVGDRQDDIHGARAHGIDTIAVSWGYGTRTEHEVAGAWAIADDPAEVISLITGRRNRT
jgi:phosphoglycolate phosphatase